MSAYVSFENGWFDGNGNVTPIGTMQQQARAWLAATPNALGTHIAATALVLDYFQVCCASCHYCRWALLALCTCESLFFGGVTDLASLWENHAPPP
jgi:hypothetical protein